MVTLGKPFYMDLYQGDKENSDACGLVDSKSVHQALLDCHNEHLKKITSGPFYAYPLNNGHRKQTQIAPAGYNRYDNFTMIGSGSYGVVWSAFDYKAHEWVAIKKISGLHHQKFCQNTLREIKILTRLKHENVIDIKGLIGAPSTGQPYVVIVQTLMDTTLREVLKGYVEAPGYLTVQILRGLSYIHSHNVIHRDLKPENLLVNWSTMSLKICDFGWARVFNPQEDHTGFGTLKKLTEYVVTRWYRAPEVILGAGYTAAVDVWSVGCILYEILSNKFLFPGSHQLDQLDKITNILGTPTGEDLQSIPDINTRSYWATCTKARLAWNYLLPTTDANTIDLLNRMLFFNQRKRITAKEALWHPRLKTYKDAEPEGLAVNPFTFEVEYDHFEVPYLQEQIESQVKMFEFEQTHNKLREASRYSKRQLGYE